MTGKTIAIAAASLVALNMAYVAIGIFPPVYSYQERYVLSGDDLIKPIGATEADLGQRVRVRRICVYWRGISLEKNAVGQTDECEVIRR